ncbi:MAG: prepilin peptidase [Gemmatimonadaceae bacterium]|nr:prepilin peptidase [Gemmatimonadaceae bacterium]
MFRLTDSPLWIPLAGGLFTGALVIASAADVRSRRIPNGMAAGLLGMGVLVQLVGHGVAGLSTATLGALTGLAIWLPFWLLHMMGGGDVKLFAAGAAWLGPLGAAEGAMLAGLCGGLLSLGWLLWTRGAGYTALRLQLGVRQPRQLHEPSVDARDARVPYALAMTAGLLLAWWKPGLILGGVA